VQKYASCSNECFILALIYIDRLIERNNFLLTELNVHRVVLTAILLAAKFFDDAYYNNAYYAKVGGVLVSELNGLEVDFLFRINFSLHASPDVFEKYKAELVAHSINSGLIVAAHLSSPSLIPSQQKQLPHIPEMESSGMTSSSTDSNMMDAPEPAQHHHHQQHHQEQQYPFPTAPMNNTSTHINSSIPQVTPSPSLSSQDISGMVNGNIGMGPIPNSSSNGPVIIQSQPQRMDQLLTTNNTAISAPFQPLHVSTMTASNPNKSYSQQQQQLQQQHQSILLQRANSLPHFSTGRCVDHAFKLPYSAPPMPATVPNVLAAVNQEQYQLMMNQLFPIESTLVHHNHHEVAAGTAATTNISNHHQHHVNTATGAGQYNNYHTAGANHHGLGSMAYQAGWTGEIR
jgi:hypothetical protein